MRKLIFGFIVCLSMLPGSAPADDNENSWATRSGYYRVSFASDLKPLTINRIHRWIFHIEDSSGNIVANAALSLVGGMPEHNHGLPTKPRMTKSLGNGDYVVEGMRFHMSGYWELTLTVDADNRKDTVVIPLTIQ